MLEIIILGIILIWLIIATVIDLKIKEVPNWISFSLILIAISIFILKSLNEKSIIPIKLCIISFAIFLIIGNIMYHTRQWGGGDSKLLMGIGAALPVYPEILKTIFNPKLGNYFPLTIIVNIIIIGSIYGLLWSFGLMIKNKEKFLKEFKKVFIKNKKITKSILILSTIGIVFSVVTIEDLLLKTLLSFLFILLILLNYLFIVTKSVENSSMYKKISTKKLREGDWIMDDIVINKKVIYSPRSIGVTLEQIKKIKKYKKEVIIKEGIAFVPAITLAVIISLIYGNVLLWII